MSKLYRCIHELRYYYVYLHTFALCVVCCGRRRTLSYGTILSLGCNGPALLLAYGTYYIGISKNYGCFFVDMVSGPSGPYPLFFLRTACRVRVRGAQKNRSARFGSQPVGTVSNGIQSSDIISSTLKCTEEIVAVD